MSPRASAHRSGDRPCGSPGPAPRRAMPPLPSRCSHRRPWPQSPPACAADGAASAAIRASTRRTSPRSSAMPSRRATPRASAPALEAGQPPRRCDAAAPRRDARRARLAARRRCCARPNGSSCSSRWRWRGGSCAARLPLDDELLTALARVALDRLGDAAAGDDPPAPRRLTRVWRRRRRRAVGGGARVASSPIRRVTPRRLPGRVRRSASSTRPSTRSSRSWRGRCSTATPRRQLAALETHRRG